jgi:hypothetical protein
MNKRTIAHVGGAYKQRIAPGNPTKGSYSLTQCYQRIDPGGAAHRYVAGGQSNHRQHRQSSCGPNLILPDRSADKGCSSRRCATVRRH